MRTSLSVVTALLLVACYNPTIPDGKVQCAADKSCPEGLTCSTVDNRCYKPGSGPGVGADMTMNNKCAACTGATPKCDPKTLTCVACLEDADCPAGSLCMGMACKQGCSSLHPSCGADGGTCDVDLGVCRGCAVDADCMDPASPRCDATSGTCVACLPTNDNCGAGKYCAQSNGAYSCVAGCKSKMDCMGGGGGGGDGGVEDGGMGGTDGGSAFQMFDCCDHKCIDVSADQANCGTCGKACGGAQSCCSGACADPMSDPMNCGACGKVCGLPNTTATCAAGKCAVGTCKTGFAHCSMEPNDGCEVNLQTDPANCGMCGKTCANPTNAVAGCTTMKGDMMTSPTCGIGSCNTGYADCDNDSSNGCEVNTQSDPKHCGACGKACPAVANGTAACVNGACVIGSCNMGFAHCSNNMADGCEVNLLADPMNCNGCAKACPAVMHGKAACSAGACVIGTCDPGFLDCDKMYSNGCETTPADDLKNCGACNKACPSVLNGTPQCSGGQCGIKMCNTGFAHCSNDLTTGCETNTAIDVKNCGMCNKACPIPGNGSASCTAGVCGVSTCNPGFATCVQGMPCATKIVDNPQNCGACGVVCQAQVPHGTTTCKGNTCVIASCDPGYAHCTGDYKSGCETPITTIQNCGGCGKPCPAVANGSPACVNGTCGIGSCNPNYAHCSTNPTSGCETYLQTNANCGGCGKTCGAVFQGSSSCNGQGACVVTQCNYPFADCDKNPANGCETNLQSNGANCGSCNKGCSSGGCNVGYCTGVTGSTTVFYSGTSFCPVCGSPTYGCTGQGTLGTQNFQSPVAGLPRSVSVNFQIEGCNSSVNSVMNIYINNAFIGSFALPYACACNSCQNHSVSTFFPGGIPGYNINGTNQLRVVVGSGAACGRSATITLTT